MNAYGFAVGDTVEHVKDIGGMKGIVIHIDSDHDLGDITTCNVVWGATTLDEALALKSDSDIQWTNKLVVCDGQPETLAPPEGYETAFARLGQFVSEEIDWDGQGGVPADEETQKAVERYLRYAHQLGLLSPSLILSHTGAVSIIWKDDMVYAAINLKGGEQYSAIVLQEHKPKISLQAKTGEYPEAVEKALSDRFSIQA